MTSTSVSKATKMVLLKSSDGDIFEVDVAVALQSQTIRHIIEDGCADKVIPVANVTSKILTKVIEYCKNHVEKEPEEYNVVEKIEKLKIDEKKPIEALVEKKEVELETDAEKELEALDDEFINVDTDTLYDIIMAANYLNIKGLLDLACQKVADMIKGKKPEEIRQIFNIKYDFTEEQEEQVRREQSWAFDS